MVMTGTPKSQGNFPKTNNLECKNRDFEERLFTQIFYSS